MSTRRLRDGRRGWRAALALSTTAHGLLLFALVAAVALGERGDASVPAADVATAGMDVAVAPTFVDLQAVEAIPPPVPVPAPEAAPPPDLTDARQADRARAAAAATAPQPGAGGHDRAAPAPDRGDGPGLARAAPAFRRDSSTLHERVSDGADTYQPSRARTAGAPASPEAVRREPETGAADSARTVRPRRAPPAAAYGASDPDQPGRDAPTADGVRTAAPAVEEGAAGAFAARAVLASADGPLDADRGARSFDVAARGPAADDDTVRAASDEARPGITDFTRAATLGRGADGRGPSEAPGATPHPTAGLAASLSGAPDATPAATLAERARERQYTRYRQEIRNRVREALVWPKQLALRLEQGETIVRFVVRQDGGIGDAPRIVKSSGFAEFDEAALEAVRRALPFPPLPQSLRPGPLPIPLPVAFENPLIR